MSSGLISASPSAYELVDNVDTVLPVAADNLSSPDRNASPLSFDPPPPVLSDYASNDEEPLDNYEVWPHLLVKSLYNAIHPIFSYMSNV